MALPTATGIRYTLLSKLGPKGSPWVTDSLGDQGGVDDARSLGAWLLGGGKCVFCLWSVRCRSVCLPWLCNRPRYELPRNGAPLYINVRD
jgi:hypothetical protein